ncbi:putative oxidoreductase [Enterobacter soli ATCC BAA-2102]|nr:putative oxidoreductase [Enterobacter soli ATCC BAA-2102]
MDERGYCRGCMRTRDERFNWQNFSDTQKQDILRLCRQRLLRKIRANKAGETEEPQQPSLF